MREGDSRSTVLAESRKVKLEYYIGKRAKITYKNIGGVVYADQQAVLVDSVILE